MLETRADESESGIFCSTNHSSCFKEYFKDIVTSQADVTQHLLHQRNENNELKEISKEEVELENTIVPKTHHSEIRKLKKSRQILEDSIIDLDNHTISCIQTRFNFQQVITLNKK